MKSKLKYTHVTRCKVTGRDYAAYRRSGTRTPIHTPEGKPAVVGSPEFFEAYTKIHSSFEKPHPARHPVEGSMTMLIQKYRATDSFQNLKAATKGKYEQHLTKIIGVWGHLPAAEISPSDIAALQDKVARAGAPRVADQLVSRLKVIFDLAIRLGLVTSNPANSISRQHKSKPHQTWKAEDLGYLITNARADVGVVILWLWRTGLRIEDCLSIDASMIKQNVLHIVESKTGTSLAIPLHRDLQTELFGRKAKPLHAILTNSNGKRWGYQGFYSALKKERARLGIETGASIHGIRRAAVVSLLEAECTIEETMAVTGQSSKMVLYYGADFERSKLAKSAMEKLSPQ